MRGHHVERRWGWDCHGLPIENIVEKDLKVSGRKEIETIGVDTFNEYARSKVLGYANEWRQTIERIGRWVDYDGAYMTMDNSFIESVWALKEIWDKNWCTKVQRSFCIVRVAKLQSQTLRSQWIIHTKTLRTFLYM